MLTKAHSNLSEDPILRDIWCLLSSTEHPQLTALITLQNWALDFRCQHCYEQESQHRKKHNSTFLFQLLVRLSWIRWADIVIESTASVLSRILMYSAKYKEPVFLSLLSLMLQTSMEKKVPTCHWRYFFHCWTLWTDWTSNCLTIMSFSPLISEKNLRTFKQFYVAF